MSMHQENQPLTYEQVLNAHVAAGKMVAFVACDGEREEFTAVSRRAAVWLLQALEGRLESYAPEAVTQGRAWRIDYQYGTQRITLGTYSIAETYDFWRGILHYCKRKYKHAIRKVRQVQQREAAAKKGGAVL